MSVSPDAAKNTGLVIAKGNVWLSGWSGLGGSRVALEEMEWFKMAILCKSLKLTKLNPTKQSQTKLSKAPIEVTCVLDSVATV